MPEGKARVKLLPKRKEEEEAVAKSNQKEEDEALSKSKEEDEAISKTQKGAGWSLCQKALKRTVKKNSKSKSKCWVEVMKKIQEEGRILPSPFLQPWLGGEQLKWLKLILVKGIQS